MLDPEKWGYPPIGVYFADGPDGHDAFCLDYRECGPSGEPTIVYVEHEFDADCEIIELAPNFEAFVRGLVPDGIFQI